MYDLNIRHKSMKSNEYRQIIQRAWELGWNCIAWNTISHGKATTSAVRANIVNLDLNDQNEANFNRLMSGQGDILQKWVNKRKKLTDTTGSLRQLQRITLTIDDIIDAQSLTSGNELLKSFDIVAVRPENIKIFSYLCKTADIDIICLDFTHRLPFNLNKKLLDCAVERGITFEVQYSSILSSNSSNRRELFSNTTVLIEYLKGKNIILTSGADAFNQLRAPYDVINLGQLLNIKQELAINSIDRNCAQVVQHAMQRRANHLPGQVMSDESFTKAYPEASAILQKTSSGIAERGESVNKKRKLNE
jgi:RNase P/RNase MRP subunit p30